MNKHFISSPFGLTMAFLMFLGSVPAAAAYPSKNVGTTLVMPDVTGARLVRGPFPTTCSLAATYTHMRALTHLAVVTSRLHRHETDRPWFPR